MSLFWLLVIVGGMAGIAFLGILGMVWWGLGHVEQVLTTLPWNRWLTLGETSEILRRSDLFCRIVISCIDKKNLEVETLPGVRPHVQDDIEKYGPAPWDIHCCRFRIVDKSNRRKKPKTKAVSDPKWDWLPGATPLPA